MSRHRWRFLCGEGDQAATRLEKYLASITGIGYTDQRQMGDEQWEREFDGLTERWALTDAE